MSTNLLTDEDLQQYCAEGYVVAEQLIDSDTLGQIDETIIELTDQALGMEDFSTILELEPEKVDGQPVPRRIYQPFLQHETFRALGSDSRILDCIEQLIGADIQVQHSKLNMKPAKVGSVVEWHQDLTYFPHTNDDLVSTLVYLDEATVENGCLQVLPRQHHSYLDHATKDGIFAGMVTEDLSDGHHGDPVPLEAPAGSVIFMHCLLPHSSLPNTSDKGRRTMIFEYRAADSYPLYFGELVSRNESQSRQLRGQPATYARFGEIAPLIPRLDGMITSLYDLQSRTKARD